MPNLEVQEIPPVALSRVEAVRELLRLERRVARAEAALRLLLAHRERLLARISEA